MATAQRDAPVRAAAAAAVSLATPPAAAPMSPATQPDQAALPRSNMDTTTLFAACAAQLLNAHQTWRRSTGGGSLLLRASPLIIALNYMAALLVALCAPRFYMRHRTALLMGTRLGTHLLPSFRNPNVGTAMALHKAAQPGALGAVRDLLSTLLGNRTLPLLVIANFAMLPPVATLVMHAAMTALEWNASGYCSTPLLSDPLSQRRQAALAAALEHAALPLVAFQPMAGELLSTAVLAGKAEPEAVCRATHSFLHICCGLLAPVLLSAWRWPVPPTAEDSSSASMWRGSLQRAAAGMDTHLRLATGQLAAAGPSVRALVWWCVLVATWLVGKSGAGL